MLNWYLLTFSKLRTPHIFRFQNLKLSFFLTKGTIVNVLVDILDTLRNQLSQRQTSHIRRSAMADQLRLLGIQCLKRDCKPTFSCKKFTVGSWSLFDVHSGLLKFVRQRPNVRPRNQQFHSDILAFRHYSFPMNKLPSVTT